MTNFEFVFTLFGLLLALAEVLANVMLLAMLVVRVRGSAITGRNQSPGGRFSGTGGPFAPRGSDLHSMETPSLRRVRCTAGR